MTAEQTLSEIKQYIEDRMAFNRQTAGKFSAKNEELWRLKVKLQELDPTVTNVGSTFDEHENANYDVRGQ